MAAGNTPAEALVHALSEIFERHVAARAYRERLRLPTIPHRDLAGLTAGAAIERLAADGLRVIVKDGSLGGVYPVVAVLLYDPRQNTHLVRFAGDPFLDVAIQRCLTEACQGLDYPTIRSRMHPLRWETDGALHPPHPGERGPDGLERFIAAGDAPFPGSIAIATGQPRHREAFVTGEADNRRLLRRLVGVIREQGGELLVRDVSYLGFPAYLAYVPRLSDAFAGRRRRPGSWRPQRLLARLADASPAEVAAWLDAGGRRPPGRGPGPRRDLVVRADGGRGGGPQPALSCRRPVR
jgi:ribosomal protein S12 methylthiotransferase accessory factor